MHNIRSTGSYIRGTNGNSNGIVPMLRVFNDTARYTASGQSGCTSSIVPMLRVSLDTAWYNESSLSSHTSTEPLFCSAVYVLLNKMQCEFQLVNKASLFASFCFLLRQIIIGLHSCTAYQSGNVRRSFKSWSTLHLYKLSRLSAETVPPTLVVCTRTLAYIQLICAMCEQVCRPGRWQAQGCFCSLPRAVAQ